MQFYKQWWNTSLIRDISDTNLSECGTSTCLTIASSVYYTMVRNEGKLTCCDQEY